MNDSNVMAPPLADVFHSIGSIEDVFLMGYVDRESVDRPVFQLFPTLGFIQFENGYLRLDSGKFEGQLSLTITDDVDMDTRLLGEPTIEPMMGRVSLLFFGENSSLRIAGVTCYVDQHSRPDERLVRAAEFHFELGNSLFIDPAWTFGLRLGSSAMVQEWLESGNDSVATMTWRKEEIG